MQLSSLDMTGEQIGFHMKAAVGGLIYPDLRTLLLQ